MPTPPAVFPEIFDTIATAPYKQGSTATRVSSPTSASSFGRANLKRLPGQTQWISFQFHTENQFSRNPWAHLWIKLDGTARADALLQGRGLILGDTRPATTCSEVTFERFADPNEHPGECGVIGLADYRIYHVVVAVDDMHVYYQIRDINTGAVTTDWVEMHDHLADEEVSNINIGMAFDNNPASYALVDIRFGLLE